MSDRRGGAQRRAGLPLSAAARGAILRAAGPARRRARAPPRAIGASTSRPITSAPTPGRSNPEGEVLVVIMCEEKRAIRNLPKMLEEVPGIGVVLIGEGDLSQDLGYPAPVRAPRGRRRDRRHPGDLQGRGRPVRPSRMSTRNNVEKLLEKGFRWLMPNPTRSNQAVEIGQKWLAEQRQEAAHDHRRPRRTTPRSRPSSTPIRGRQILQLARPRAQGRRRHLATTLLREHPAGARRARPRSAASTSSSGPRARRSWGTSSAPSRSAGTGPRSTTT